ncbi:MAG: sterol desaturase family protein [Myxococcales bacterium]|nr:sterol desaturase family protein [Myxococcales bacterium]MCB9755423.1 sterol desaturase family protein [Myxococcales bacterium]
MGAWLASLSLATLMLVVAGYYIGLSALASALGFLAERALPRRRIWDVPLARGQYGFELLGNLKFLAVQLPIATAFLHFGWLRFGEGSALLTFVGMYFGFQLYYYGLHRALHHRALIRFHRWHHRSRVTTPLSGQSMGYVEALGYAVGYFAIPALCAQLGDASPIVAEGWLAYLTFNIFGNIFGHANVELGPRTTTWRLVSIFQPPYVYHALHHARWLGHYGFASTGLDRVFRSEFADWRELHARVLGGASLPSLKFRGAGEPPPRGAGHGPHGD